jgi:hypothetical protein
MLWGQRIKVYTNNKYLTQDGLGLTSNRVTPWRILLEEYGPEIIYIKGIHNTVADAISQLDYDPKVNSTNEHNHAMQNVSTKDKTCQMADVLKILVLLLRSTGWRQSKCDQLKSYICKSQ